MDLCFAEEPPKKVAAPVAEALEFKLPGRGNEFKEMRERSDAKGFEMAMDMFSHVKDGLRPTYAAEEAAKEHGVKKSTVDRAVKKYLPGLLNGRNHGVELLNDGSNLDMALDVASFIEAGRKLGLSLEPLLEMAAKHVAVNHNVSELTVTRALDKYFRKGKYLSNLSKSK